MSDTQKEGQSDYDIEWELETDDPQTSSVDDEFDQQTSDKGDLPESEAPNDPTEATSNKDDQSSEESEVVDVWAEATEAQREAFRRAENEKTAAENRAKLNSDKLAERGRELKTLREQSAELKELTREKTEFETEHSVYAKDIESMIDQRLQARLPVQEEIKQEEIDQQTFEAITNAHPTAADLYNSDGMKTLLADDPVLKHGGKAKLFSEILHSNDPTEVIAALDYYKQSHSEPEAPDASGLEDMQATPSRGGKPDMRHSSQLTSQERYDQEWELDDD